MTNISIHRIQEKKLLLDRYKPFPKVVNTKLEELYKIELIYFSNSHRLTRREVEILVIKSMMNVKKTLREYIAAINHLKATDFIHETLNKSYKTLSEQDLLTIHSLVLKNMDEKAGCFRSTSVKIAGIPIVVPDPRQVKGSLDEFFQWLKTIHSEVVTFAVDAHFKLVSIHPFMDANGRCARLLMDLILIQEGYPPVIMFRVDREKYIKVIAEAQLSSNLSNYYQFMYQNIDKSLDIYLSVLKHQKGLNTNTSNYIKRIKILRNLRKNEKNTVFVKIANCTVKIDYTERTRIISQLQDFIVPKTRRYNFFIQFKSHKVITNINDQKTNSIILPQEINRYAFGYFLRNIIQDFLEKDSKGFFLHCSGVYIGDEAYLFLGPQGGGKSTISKMLSGTASTLADDSGIITKEKNNFYFYQTPFFEKRRFSKFGNRYKIKKIYFIHKSKKCREIGMQDKLEILDLFIKQLWTDKKRLQIQIKILMQFVESFNEFYKLYFPKNNKVVTNWFKRSTKLLTSNYAPIHHQRKNYGILR